MEELYKSTGLSSSLFKIDLKNNTMRGIAIASDNNNVAQTFLSTDIPLPKKSFPVIRELKKGKDQIVRFGEGLENVPKIWAKLIRKLSGGRARKTWVYPIRISADDFQYVLAVGESSDRSKSTIEDNFEKLQSYAHYMKIITQAIEANSKLNAALKNVSAYKERLDNLPDIFFEIDTEGNLLAFNEMIYQHLGYSREESENANIFDFISATSKKNVWKRLKERVGGTPHNRPYIVEAKHKKGHYINYEIHPYSRYDEKGDLYSVMGVARNVEERLKIQRKLETSLNEVRFINSILDKLHKCKKLDDILPVIIKDIMEFCESRFGTYVEFHPNKPAVAMKYGSAPNKIVDTMIRSALKKDPKWIDISSIYDEIKKAYKEKVAEWTMEYFIKNIAVAKATRKTMIYLTAKFDLKYFAHLLIGTGETMVGSIHLFQKTPLAKSKVKILKIILSHIEQTYQREIYEKRSIEEARRALLEHERYHTIFEEAAEAILLLDFNGNILDVNPSFIRMTGFTKDQVQQKRIWELDFFPFKEHAFRLREEIEKLVKNEIQSPYDITIRSKSRQDIMWEINGKVIKTVEGDRILLMVRDVTLQRKSAENASQEQRLKSLATLAAGQAHEIGNSLVGALGYTDLLLENMDPEGGEYIYLQKMRKSVLRCKQILQDMMNVVPDRGGGRNRI
jgi:PAS domain S-box-containing protein